MVVSKGCLRARAPLLATVNHWQENSVCHATNQVEYVPTSSVTARLAHVNQILHPYSLPTSRTSRNILWSKSGELLREAPKFDTESTNQQLNIYFELDYIESRWQMFHSGGSHVAASAPDCSSKIHQSSIA